MSKLIDDEVLVEMKIGAVVAGGALVGAGVAHIRKRNRAWGAVKGAFWPATIGAWAWWVSEV